MSEQNNELIGPDKTPVDAVTPLGNVYNDNYKKTGNKLSEYVDSYLSGNSKVSVPHDEITQMKDVTASEETGYSIKRLITSYYNLALIFGSVGVEHIVNYIGRIVLDTDDLSSIDKDEAIVNLKDKMNKFQSIVKDEKTKDAFRKASQSINEIAAIFMEEAQEPMMRIGERAVKIGIHTLQIMLKQSLDSLEDSIKLIPIFGEGYTIVQNMIDMGSSASSIGQGYMKYYSDLSSAYGEISDGLGGNPDYSEGKESLKEAFKDLKNIFQEIMKKTTDEANDLSTEYAATSTDEQFQKNQGEERKALESKKQEQEQKPEEQSEKQAGGNKKNKSKTARRKKKVRFTLKNN